jgi:hypothetical protein
MPNPDYAPRPLSNRTSLLIRIVDASSQVFPGADIDIIGPETRRVRSGKGGIVLVENLVPGSYRVVIARPAKPGEQIETTLELTAGVVHPMAMLGEPSKATAVPVQMDNSCCKPYGAPPARRRVV